MAKKRQRKKFNLGCHKDRKENPINAPSIHIGALVMGVGSLWPMKMIFVYFLKQKNEVL
jgi:hypothetical protein